MPSFHLLGCFGLGLGILAACYVSPFDVQGTWLTYHVLTAAWIVHGLAILIAAVAAFSRMWVGALETRILANAATDESSNEIQSSILDSRCSVFLGWLHAIGLLVLALGLGSALADPGRLYWSSGPVMAVSTTSLTVPPRPRRTTLIWSRLLRAQAQRRWGPMGPLRLDNGVKRTTLMADLTPCATSRT